MTLWLAFFLFVIGTILLRTIKARSLRDIGQLVLNFGLLFSVFFTTNLIGSALLILIVMAHFYCIRIKILNIVLPLLLICLYRFFPSYSLVGISFVCFRLISASLEISNDEIKRPDLKAYLLYVFYFPTFKLGPIGRLKDHLLSLEEEYDRSWNDLNWVQLARVLYGAVKFVFIAALISNFHQSLDVRNVLGKGAFLYVTMYLSFSGFNDIAIGVSHFLRMRMKENFHHPFLARNVGEFWSRWHISLTDILKEMIFYPMNLALIRKFGKNSKYIVTPLSFIFLFLAIGLWHGFTANFLLLGIYYALGAITAFYFSSLMMKIYPRYKESRIAISLSIILTQVYIAISFFIFYSEGKPIREIIFRITGLLL